MKRFFEKLGGVRRTMEIAVCTVILACIGPGCASAYDKTLHQMALPADDLLAARVTEMVGCADHAIKTLEDARAWYTSAQGEAPDLSDTQLKIVVNDAEAEVFEFSRRVLSVEDVAGEPGSDTAASVERLRVSMATCRQSLNAAVVSVREWMSGASTVADAGVMRESTPQSVDQAVDAARADVDVLRADAARIMAR